VFGDVSLSFLLPRNIALGGTQSRQTVSNGKVTDIQVHTQLFFSEANNSIFGRTISCTVLYIAVVLFCTVLYIAKVLFCTVEV